MRDTAHRAVAVVGLSAILPDARNVNAFWQNLKDGRYSISDVDPARWDPNLYFDPDPAATDKSYSKIGGFVREFDWDPRAWKMPIPPTVSSAMDDAQRWAISCSYAALTDFGYPERKLDTDRTAVILGNAMAGEKHYATATRVAFPEFARELAHSPSFAALNDATRSAITIEARDRFRHLVPEITEDTMPGELANVIAGRIANLFNLHGPNYVVDAACASAMAAISAAMEGLEEHDFDTVITGGIDRNMGASTYVKFCKIGALSATGTRPYADGADGFVMGEGTSLFLLKRLEDAERDGDRIYAVLRSMGGSSDGRGKGITAPNPKGQKLAVQRAWENAGLSPSTASYVEGHGTSTRVGDVVEVESLSSVFASAGATPHSIGLGSVKSNIGHLKGAAGAAGLLKTILALHEKVLPPSINFDKPNPNIDFTHSPFHVVDELRDWEKPGCGVRRAGVSAFGFGGTNFHAVLEEHVPGMLTGNGRKYVQGAELSRANDAAEAGMASGKTPLRGAVLLGADTPKELGERLRKLHAEAQASHAPAHQAPLRSDLDAPERLAIDFKDPAELARKTALALKAIERDDPLFWRSLAAQGIFRGRGQPGKVAFLYPGQGSQYPNMLHDLRAHEPAVRAVFEQADRVMEPLLGTPLSQLIFVDEDDPAAMRAAGEALKQTEVTQPAVLTVDAALTSLLGEYGIAPDMVMGHSLGEYAALTTAGALGFGDALEAVSARGREMTRVSVDDNGKMAAVFAPLADVERIVASVDGYVVIANVNSRAQAVIGGTSPAVDEAVERFAAAGIDARHLPVSHAFHTKIVGPASEPLRKALTRLRLHPPRMPAISNVTGEFYDTGENAVDSLLQLLQRQIASPVQFVKGIEKLYDEGVRVFVEVGPKKALSGFVDDVLGDKGDVVSLFTNHPKVGELVSFNQALCGLYAAGCGAGRAAAQPAATVATRDAPRAAMTPAAPSPALAASVRAALPQATSGREQAMGNLFMEFLDRGRQLFGMESGGAPPAGIVITGAALGLPGTPRVFDDRNVSRILHGEQFIDVIPHRFRQAMLDKHIVRLVKRADGDPTFESIDRVQDVIKLAGRAGAFDAATEFGIKPERVDAFDSTTALAVAVGIDALRDAGIPLVQHYKTTSTGTKLPERWGLPESMRDDTGVIFASAFPGIDAFAQETEKYYEDHGHREQLAALESLREWMGAQANGHGQAIGELDRRIEELRGQITRETFHFDRRYLFRVLSMGHSQFAEEIGARGPNTQVNGACASTTQAVALAEDWIRGGRCRRVIIVSADNVTSDNLIEWIGAGFLSTGAAATDESVKDAALPFDRRRHGMIAGMGAAAMVVEREDAARERHVAPICEVLGSITANSAFHGTRLDVSHIGECMEKLVAGAEARHGISRTEIAPNAVFVSHETYTPARGGSASAEVHALRSVFGEGADRIVVANTKGYTGHAMGAGIEDVLAIKSLETGLVPPVPNYREVDPELGTLNLSKGGAYPVQYALRLGAGFGSQIAMTLVRWVPTADGRRRAPEELGFDYRVTDRNAFNAWLSEVSGQAQSELEVVQRRLRVKDQGLARAPAPQPAIDVPVDTTVPATSAPAPAAVAPAAPAPVAPTAAAPAAPAAVDTGGGDAVQARILELVAEKTGYPSDMLDMDLDLEADLGVDTVKQADMFASVREAYDIPRDPDLKLRDFPTLEHVVGFVYDHRPELRQQATVTAPAPSPAAPAAAPAADATASVQARILEMVAEKTGYPSDMLDMDLDLEADLGVDTVKQADMFATVREAYDIPRDPDLKLRDFPTLEHVVGFVYDHRPELRPTASAPAAAPAPAPTVAAAPAAAPAPVATSSPAAVDPVQVKVLEMVAEKTGYPQDMLDMDLDLEADLGVDTVKQADMFATIRGEYDIPRDPDLKLRDFPTLEHVVGFVYDHRPDLQRQAPAAAPAPSVEAIPAVTVTPVAAEPAASTAAAPADAVRESVLTMVAEKTGYPQDMLEMDLDLEADLGVDTVKQADMFATIRGEYDIPRDPDLKLRDFPTLEHVVGFVYDHRPDLREQTPAAPAPVPAAAPAATAEPAAAAASADDEVAERLLTLVSEKTGYPKDMLELDLDLEADLGVDTVKQADLFATVREAYGIPRDPDLKLREFPTLAHVIGFVHDRRPDQANTAAAAKDEPAQATSAAAAAAAAPAGDMAAANAVPRRVPGPVWRPPLSQCKPTGVSLEAGKRVIVMPDQGGVAKALVGRLGKRGVEALVIEGKPDRDALDAQIAGWLADGAIDGVYWLPALDAAQALADMNLEDWREALRVRVKLMHTTMRALYEHIAAPDKFLVAATRLGGQHGYDERGALNPLGGAVCGFAKAFRRERDALVKVVDFDESRKTAALADRLIDETLGDPGAVEIGIRDDERWTVGVQDTPAGHDADAGLTLDAGTVFAITGAAGSIVAAITSDLAAASGGVFHLLDLTPAPDADDPDIALYGSDREALKRSMFERIKAQGERATPARIDKELARLERAHAALSAIQAVERAGGTAHYHAVDLTDGAAVGAVVERIRETSGQVDVLVHAAGLEISRFLPDKAPAEFDLVFDVKSDGWFNLLHAIGDMPLKSAVVFSSVAGRFGNAGQTDYSAANDLLCKCTSAFRNDRTDAIGIAVDWTAWGGIGMATRGSIPQMMAKAGIDMLPPEAGIPVVRRELTLAHPVGELVVGNRLGVLMDEWDDTGGLDTTAIDTASCGPLVGEVRGMGVYSGLTVETDLDPTKQPFLDDHRIDGTPVLPGVMGLESFAEIAQLPFPGWHVAAIEDVSFLEPFKFYRSEPRTVTLRARFLQDAGDIVADCELIGVRKLKKQAEPRITTHFRARVRLTREAPETAASPKPELEGGPRIHSDDVYRVYFHGPAYQVLDGAWRDGPGTLIGQMREQLPEDHLPADRPLTMAPRHIELCLQTAGMYEVGATGHMRLPSRIKQLVKFREPEKGKLMYSVVRRRDNEDGFDAEVLDEAGAVYLRLVDYRSAEHPDELDPSILEPIRIAVES